MTAEAPAKWWEGQMGGLDTESTGVDPHTARIVTSAVGYATPGQRPRVLQWLINPGCDIPAEAAAVHGWTLDRIEERLAGHEAIRITDKRDTPMPRDAALFEIASHTATIIGAGVPLVIANAPYDLTLLEAELARNSIDPLTSRPKGIAGVVDPMVIEKAFDPYRKTKNGCRGGKHQCGGCGAEDRKLASLCLHYGVVHAGAHDAAADVIAAMRLAKALGAIWPSVGRLKLGTLHNHQVTWRREQANGLREYFDKNGIEHDGVDPGWPLLEGRSTP